MKTMFFIKQLILIGFILLNAATLKSQVTISDSEDFSDVIANSAVMDIQLTDGGILIPSVVLDFNGSGVIYAPNLTASPADGLTIFHDGSNGITKGFWFYDAVLPGWVLYSDWASDFSIDLTNYGEMYESNDFGSGTSYPLTNTYFIPWRSASSGLLGSEFVFHNNATVNTETGTALSDQIEVTGNDAVYSVNVSVTVVSTTAGNEITGQLYVNDQPVNSVFFRHTFQNKNYPTNCFTSGLIELNMNDRIDFRFSSITALEGIKIELLNLKITKVGEL